MFQMVIGHSGVPSQIDSARSATGRQTAATAEDCVLALLAGVGEEAELATLSFLARHAEPGASPMCGNSICQDRRFLARWMPELERFFHYRNLDVSTLKELARRWAPAVAEAFHKESRHLALSDIHDSIEELKHYREHLLRLP